MDSNFSLLFKEEPLNAEIRIENTPIYKRTAFPEPADTIVSLDNDGLPLSKFSDDNWDFRSVYGGYNITFTGKKNIVVSKKNLRLVKSAFLYILYDKRVFKGYMTSLKPIKALLMKLAAIADEHDIKLTSLSRYPSLWEQCTSAFNKSRWDKHISIFSKFYHYNNDTNFTILDDKALTEITNILAVKHNHQTQQHPVIPPRIWSYKIMRLEECLDAFNSISNTLEQLIEKIMSAYEYNTEFLANFKKGYSKGSKHSYISPFNASRLKGMVYFGKSVTETLVETGLIEVISKFHHLPKSEIRITILTTWLYGFQNAAMMYVQFFSMQRVSEAFSLTKGCLSKEVDPRFGDIYILSGDTSKTIEDDDAKWVVPERVKKAVDVLETIARIFYKYAPNHLKTCEDSYPLWFSSSIQHQKNYNSLNRAKYYSTKFNQLFDEESLKITPEDYRIACALTPSLLTNATYAVGIPWHFSSHQCRRSLIIFMMSSGLVSNESLQYLAKHMNTYMTLYYGRNYTKILLNQNVQKDIIVEGYLNKARQINQIAEGEVGIVFPHKKNTLKAIAAKDETSIIQMLKEGQTHTRKTLLGYCTRIGACEYGGIESVTACTGVISGGICAEAIFAAENKQSLLALKEKYRLQIADMPLSSPRRKALVFEINAIEIYESKLNEK